MNMDSITVALICFFIIVMGINSISSADTDDDLSDLTLESQEIFDGLGNLFSVSHENEVITPVMFTIDINGNSNLCNIEDSGF